MKQVYLIVAAMLLLVIAAKCQDAPVIHIDPAPLPGIIYNFPPVMPDSVIPFALQYPEGWSLSDSIDAQERMKDMFSKETDEEMLRMIYASDQARCYDWNWDETKRCTGAV